MNLGVFLRDDFTDSWSSKWGWGGFENILRRTGVLLKNIKQRLFPESLVTNFKIFSIDIIRNLKQDDIGSFGREELDLLIVHFGVEKYYGSIKFPPFIEAELVRNEWRILKLILQKNYLEQKENKIWQRFIKTTIKLILIFVSLFYLNF